MARAIKLRDITSELNDCVYTSGKYPLLVDTTGQACQFLKYRGRYLSILKKGDFEKETLRKALVQALHNGAWLVLDFDKLECDLQSYFDKDSFPEMVLSPHELFLEENFTPLLRPTDEFAAKVTYEHQAALAEGAFQDRTKCHAPERVADVSKKFDPKDSFRLVLATKQEEPPASLKEKMVLLKVDVSENEVKENAGRWAGREQPKKEKSKEQVKMDEELLEFAFDGELQEVQTLLDKSADPMAKDGRGNTALSEAAVQGHIEVVKCLLDWKAPIGSDPNAAGNDGRTALHRACFQGHQAVAQVLLEHGSDPRTKDRHGELPYDMASNDETRAALEAWDSAKTDSLKEERAKAIDAEDEKNVRNEEERLQLARRKKTAKLCELTERGDKDALELELLDLDRKEIPAYRDDRGNSILHLAATHGRQEIVTLLFDSFGFGANPRDSKGWTPIAVAAFHGHKKICQVLMARKADPLIENAYRKDAFAVAKDDEIKETLKCVDTPSEVPIAGASSITGGTENPAEEAPDEAEPAIAKAKAKGKAKSGPKSGGKPKAKAKGR
ncbi:TNKS2 [Symbiodinium microadriaticum]|nr:TNKS2 [Symbiodinium microadriaticum]CAE7925936.1 TNKS2 [Symbiodinium sp. KB8]